MIRFANILVLSTIAVCLVTQLTGCSEQQWRELTCQAIKVPATNVPLVVALIIAVLVLAAGLHIERMFVRDIKGILKDSKSALYELRTRFTDQVDKNTELDKNTEQGKELKTLRSSVSKTILSLAEAAQVKK